MPHLIFVYGTLKHGFPNAHRNPGRRVAGRYRTRQPLPFYVVRLHNEERAPWLVHAPGEGHQVTGELFEIDDATLLAMDRFEEVGLPQGYVRVELELEREAARGSRDAHTVVRAYSYLKQQLQLTDCLRVEGPFPEYTLELAQGYWLDFTEPESPAQDRDGADGGDHGPPAPR